MWIEVLSRDGAVAARERIDREALLAQLTMQGVSHANAVALGRRFLEAIEWQR